MGIVRVMIRSRFIEISLGLTDKISAFGISTLALSGILCNPGCRLLKSAVTLIWFVLSVDHTCEGALINTATLFTLDLLTTISLDNSFISIVIGCGYTFSKIGFSSLAAVIQTTVASTVASPKRLRV